MRIGPGLANGSPKHVSLLMQVKQFYGTGYVIIEKRE
jgi:hypothetical protein